MGQITSHIEDENQITVKTVEGEIEADQLLRHIVMFLSENPTQLVLWDLTKGSLNRISAADLLYIVMTGKPFSYKRTGGRTAIVCSEDFEYNRCKLFQTIADLQKIPIKFFVCASEEEAREWLVNGWQEPAPPEEEKKNPEKRSPARQTPVKPDAPPSRLWAALSVLFAILLFLSLFQWWQGKDVLDRILLSASILLVGLLKLLPLRDIVQKVLIAVASLLALGALIAAFTR